MAMEKLPSSKEKGNISSVARMLALSAILFLSNPESKAQETKNNEPTKESYPELVTKARISQDNLYRKLVDLRGGSIAVPPGTTISFEETTTGYKISFIPNNLEHPFSTYLISDSDSSRIVYVDHNADGQVDKIYINKSKTSDLERNSDDLKIKNLSIKKIKDNEFARTLMGKDITIFEISSSQEGYEVSVFDFKDKKQGGGTGGVAEEFVHGIQKTYLNSLESMIHN